MKSGCGRNARGEEEEREGETTMHVVEDARTKGGKGEKKSAKRSDGERKRFQLDSVHRGELFSRPSAPFAVTAHTFPRNELDYWLNPDRGITYSVKKVSPREESREDRAGLRERERERERERNRDEGCVHTDVLRRPPPPSLPLTLSLSGTRAARRMLAAQYERERPRTAEWMWVSVLRAKVKPVAGVAEVGRIRVTDQRAPRERPAPENPPRLRRGPSVSSRARIASKTRALYPAIRSPARSSVCTRTSLSSSFSFLPDHPEPRAPLPSPGRISAPLSSSRVVIILPFPSQAILRPSCVPRRSARFPLRAFYHIPLCPLF